MRPPSRPLRHRISRYLKEWLFTLCCLAVMSVGCVLGLLLAVNADSDVAPPAGGTIVPADPPGAVVLHRSPPAPAPSGSAPSGSATPTQAPSPPPG